MAQLLPSLSSFTSHSLGHWRELQVLQHIQHSLPDGYQVFHSVDWHSLHQGRDCHGEIDIVVMNQAGELLLIEVKAGDVACRHDGIYKSYNDREKKVDAQLTLQYAAMRGLLKKSGIHTGVTNCLVLPDFRVQQTTTVGIPRERIFDADDYADLGAKLQMLLPLGEEHDRARRVRDFLSNHLDVVQDVSVLHGQLDTFTRTLSDGLATWVPRIQAPSNIYRIQATAGAGKTQLALRLLQDAAHAGLTVMYTCFNRPLADHIAALVPPEVSVATFHTQCINFYRQKQTSLDFNDAAMFDAASTAYVQAMEQVSADLDLLIIDEAQDFQPAWISALVNQLKDAGKLYVLEDADQSLYTRIGFDLPDAVSLSCYDNFRSPQAVCQTLNAFGLASQPIHARSPYIGEPPAFYEYDGTPDDLLKQTGKALDDLLTKGFDIGAIALLSAHGRSRSFLLNREHIAGFQTRRFVGKFDTNGEPAWSDGELLVESVYRFKGQSAPAVILSEVELAKLTPIARRKLFVGMTRGLLAVSVVLTHQAAATLAESLET
jgi:thymidine kinase